MSTSEHDDTQYLRHLADLGERRAIVAHTPIFTRTGIKLVDSGTTLDRAVVERLMQHRLLPTLDDCLSIEGMLSPGGVRRAAEDLLRDDEAFLVLLPNDQVRQEILHAFDLLPLGPKLAFKLTVMKEERPELWAHSLQVALVATALAMAERESMSDLMDAALAGLTHDLGLLHIAPQVLAEGAAMDEAHRHHMYSHPVLAKFMLARLPQVPGRVVEAVAEHHEREDGSGYPRGIRARQISPLGELVAAAELVATVLVSHTVLPVAKRLSIVLRLNRHKLAPRYVDHLVRLADKAPPQVAKAAPKNLGASLALMVRMAEAIDAWHTLRGNDASHLATLLDERIDDLERGLADAGIDLRRWTTISADLEGNPSARAELLVLATEGGWQLDALIQELRRRRAAETAAVPGVDAWLELVGRQD